MPDLANDSERIHREVGRAAHDSENVDEVIFYGPMMADAAKEAEGGRAVVRHTESRNELEDWLRQTSREDVVIFKASHKMELHRVADDWLGTSFNMVDARSDIIGRYTVKGINYTAVKDYGACAISTTGIQECVELPTELGNTAVRQIFDKVFAYSSLREIVMHAPMITIGNNAFSNCKSLKSVHLPETLYYLGIGAFRDCTALEEIEIPDGCATIDRMAFSGCTGLRHVSLPYSLLTIGEGAFDQDCSAVFECPENSVAAEILPGMCPHATVRLHSVESPISAMPGPDLSVFSMKNGNLKKAATLGPYNKPKSVRTVTLTAVGDCTLGRNHKMGPEKSWDELFEKNGSDYFLRCVAPVFRKADIAIANLEGVLTSQPERQVMFYRQKSDAVQEKVFCYLGKPEYIRALTDGGINAVTFANNHNMDYGVQGFIDTVEACRQADLPIAYYDTVIRRKVDDITVGIVSADFSYLDTKIGTGYLRKAMADARRDCNLIIACIHWGLNYKVNPNAEQKKLGHLCVDLGADLVLGSHAHILQGIERYKGRYICYSMGNFCYGGRKSPKDNDTAILRKTFSFFDGKLQIDDELEIIPCWMSGSNEVNDFRPVIKTDEEADAIITKINMRSAAFGVSFGNDGKPHMEPAENKEIELPAAPYSDAVPSIIYSLVDET